MSDHRIAKGIDEYLIHWVGYDKPDWEPINHLNCPDLIQQYWSEVRNGED